MRKKKRGFVKGVFELVFVMWEVFEQEYIIKVGTRSSGGSNEVFLCLHRCVTFYIRIVK